MNATENQKGWHFQLHAKTHIEPWLIEAYHSINLTHTKNGSSLLEGRLPDLPAFYGILLLFRDTGLDIISLKLEKCSNDSCTLCKT